jgi:hypothetical protein
MSQESQTAFVLGLWVGAILVGLVWWLS